MGVQLTSLLRRLARLGPGDAGRGGRWSGARGAAGVVGPAGGGPTPARDVPRDVRLAVARQVRAGLAVADRRRYDALLEGVGAGARVPDAGRPEDGVPDGGVPEDGVPDGGLTDGGVPDGGLTDAGVPEDGVRGDDRPPPGRPHDGGRPGDGPSDPRRAVLERTLAATGAVGPVAAMAAVWQELRPSERAAVVDPVRLGPALRQHDGTTCGSASLVMLAALGDPTLALWLATGRLAGDHRPPELAGAPAAALAALADAGPRTRAAVLQRLVQRRTSRPPRGVPWPARFGTPPWGAAAAGRFVGLRLGHAPLDDTDPGHLRASLARVGAALDRGIPVPLFTGGDSGQSWAAAVPRHVVLAVGRDGGRLRIWEPSVGRVVEEDAAVLAAGERAHPALGGWRHLVWAVLPRD